MSRKNRAALAELVFARLAAATPEPRGELEYADPFTLLVAVVLSAQATDAGVNKATKALFSVAHTPEEMVALGEKPLSERIRTIGLYRAKARHIIALSRAILEQHGGDTPKDRAALKSLPGVGRKTANVVLNTAFGEPTVAVDTHVFRVANRLGNRAGSDPSCGRGRAHARHPPTVPGSRASLAHPARALRVQSPEAALRLVCPLRHLRVQRQDGGGLIDGDYPRRRRLTMVPPPRLERGTSRSTI